ncbi:DUF7312 domain-containing protein [Halovivax limisalsi]|uniref:DUF7312 domain-containing protein n=1 Tax=Halovivax limisalsi TaxID=1453760 RepID=UPI001FFD54E1|nr:hypothetical protein [Halovivax limisalsi]
MTRDADPEDDSEGHTEPATAGDADHRTQPSIPNPNTWADAGTNEGPDGDAGGAEPTAADEGEDSEPIPESGSTPVVAGRIDREHAAFVVLGALTTVLVLLRATGLGL